jgi:hypothetical protein
VSAIFSTIDRAASTAPSTEHGFYRPGDLVAGRYVVRELIGSGPLGLVYRAENHSSGAVVALRAIWPDIIPDDAARGRFLKETIRARSVQNRYVAPLFEAFIDEVAGQVVCLLAVKHLAGPTLASRVARRLRHGVPLLAVEAQPIVSQIGVGLSAIHRASLVHGNLRAASVYLMGDEIRIGDLGVASALPPGIVALAETHAGRGGGRAPEASSGRTCSPSSDVYAFAVLTAQMLGLLSARSRDEVPVPPSVRAVLRRALSQSPRDRYPDVDTFAGALVTAFERVDQRAAIGLRAVAPARDGTSEARGSQSDHSAVIAGALDIPPSGPTIVPRVPRRGPRADASVVIDPEAFDSRTPVTLPPLPRPMAKPAARVAARQTAERLSEPTTEGPTTVRRVGPPAAAAASRAVHPPRGRERTDARVPIAMVVSLIIAATSLSAGIVRNVVAGRFEEEMAEARVVKAEMLRRIAARPNASKGSSPATMVPSGQSPSGSYATR